MKISIIIPAYNAEKTIGKCLESLISQTYKNIEIIVVNDGSNDSTGNIVRMYQKHDKRIIYIENENNGVSYSRNCGVEVATGDYINFVDADDYLEQKCFENLLLYLNDNIDFIRYNFIVDGTGGFDDNLYELSDKKYNFNNADLNKLYSHFFTSNERIPCLVMLLVIKKSIANKIKFNEKLTMMEDVDYYIQLFNVSKKCYFINKKLYHYFINNESVSHSKKNYKKNIFGILNTNCSLRERINSTTCSNNIEAQINANHLRIISSYLKMQCKNNYKEYQDTIFELKQNPTFKMIMNDYKYLSIKRKAYYFSIKYNFKLLELLITSLWALQ